MKPIDREKFKLEIKRWGGSTMLSLDTDLREELGITTDTELVTAMFDSGKHGRYLAIFVEKKE